jgi:ABC-type transport system involved in cytochrome bd biosynthesis fused ATPase/permease subunit
VTHEAQLFAGTPREAMRFAKPDATDAEIIAAMEHGVVRLAARESGRRARYADRRDGHEAIGRRTAAAVDRAR